VPPSTGISVKKSFVTGRTEAAAVAAKKLGKSIWAARQLHLS
jgi:hypothetical protein